MEQEWSDEKYIRQAKREPKRLAFWREYFPDLLEASKAVCENPPRMDLDWKKTMGTPEEFKKQEALRKKEESQKPCSCGRANYGPIICAKCGGLIWQES